MLMVLLSSYLQQETRTLSAEGWKKGALGADFRPYYIAGKVARGEGDGRLYYPAGGNPVRGFIGADTAWGRIATANGLPVTEKFIYPPFFAVLMKPFAYLPLQHAFVAWREINTLFIVLSIVLVVLHFRAAPRLAVLVMAVAGALATFPVVEATFLGQVGGLILLLWTLGALATDRKWPVVGALCFALATMVKVTPVLVVPLLLLRRQWKWLFAYTGWMVLFLGIGIWQVSWENHVTYVTQMLPSMSSGFPNARNRSLFTVVQSVYFGDAFHDLEQPPISIPPALTVSTKAVALGLYLGLLLYFYKRNRTASRVGDELCALAILSLLISPVTWRHHYVLMLLPLLSLWMGMKRDASAWRYGVLCMSTLAVTTVFPWYLLEVVRQPVIQIALTALMPVGAAVLLGLSLTEYTRATTAVHDEQQAMPERPHSGDLIAAL